MPELPEVETVVKALGRALAGRRLEKAADIGRLRHPFDAKAAKKHLGGRAVAGVRRRAKYIIVDFDCDHGLLAHLGMTGYFHMEPSAAPLHRHDRLAFSLDGGEDLRFADARRFGFVKVVRLEGGDRMPAELAGLGCEPLARHFTGSRMADTADGRACPVKNFIMDQSVVAGVGNIYASEALHMAGIDPRRAAGTLDAGEWTALVAAVKAVLKKAVRKGGSTIRNYRTVDGGEGGFQRALRVYGKKGEACPVCGNAIECCRQGGRSTFYCPVCQK